MVAYNIWDVGARFESDIFYCDISLVVKRRVVAPLSRVRFSHITPLELTQLGECDSYKVEVVGSIPTFETLVMTDGMLPVPR